MLNSRSIRLCAPVIALGLALGVSACGGSHARYADHIARGTRYLEAGDLARAGVEFRNALQIEPKSAEALFLAAKVAAQRGAVRNAASLYQAAIEVRPDYVEPRIGLGTLYTLGGTPDRALEIVAPALATHPDDSGLLTVRAAANLQLKKTDLARADAQRAVQLDAGNEDAVALLAAMYSKAGETRRAISLVSDTLAKRPQAVDLRNVLADLLLSVGEAEQAEAQMREIVELQPSQFRPRYQLALYYARNGKPDEAQRTLEAAVKALPRNNDAKLALVDFIVAQRSRAQGEQTLRAFIASEPDNYELRLGLGALLERTGNAADAVAAYQEVSQRDSRGPAGLAALDRIASIRAGQGKIGEAQKLTEQVLAANPHDDDALALRADLELRNNDPQAAIVDLRSVVRDQPDSGSLRRLLAKAHLANGEAALAEEQLRIAMDQDANDVAARVDLARLLSSRGRAEAATTLLEQTVRAKPENLQAREALARLYIASGDWPAARRAAGDLKTLRPDSSVPYYLSGLVAQGEKHTDEAARDFTRALELQPRALDVLTSLARLEVDRGRAAVAIDTVSRAVERDPKNALVRNLLGELYLASKDLPRATQTLNEAIALAPDWWVPRRTLGLTRLASKDIPGAMAAYEGAVRVAPAEPQLTVELAGLYEHQGRIDDAIARYEGLLRSNPREHELAANNLAMLLVTYKKDTASLDRARDLTASFVASDDGELLDTSGWVRFKRGEYAQALPVLERAAARTPESRVIRYHVAAAEAQAGQRDRARENLKTALAGAANFSWAADARILLASLQASAG